MEGLVPEYDLMGHVRTRSGGALPGIAPSNTYRTADNGYVVIAGNSDAIFKRLMKVIGRDDLAGDPALAQNDGRVEQSDMLDAAIGAWTGRHGIDDVVERLEAADVPSGRIYSVADIVADAHYQARDMIVETALPGDISVKMPGITPKLSETPGSVRWPGPMLGEHTSVVLSEMGYDQSEIQQLRRTGAVQ
jgi:crotonobetainyl-CoA:carnitine CoA-transferase CaiB-like acyl-CoA transferase